MIRRLALVGVLLAAVAALVGHATIAWYIGAPVAAKSAPGTSTMCAVTFRRGGPPEVLEHACDVPTPVWVEGTGTLLIRIHYAALNPVDSKTRARANESAWLGNLPTIPGADLSGVVERADAGSGFKAGDRVMGMGPAIPVQFWGTYAEYIVLAEKHLAIVPAGVTMEQAAAIPLVGMTVAQAFRYAGFEPVVDDSAIETGGPHSAKDSATDSATDSAKPAKPAKRVLVHAAAGGVGHIAVQYASRVLGLEVTGYIYASVAG